MKRWIESLGSTVFVVLLMASMLAVLIPSVTSSPGYGVDVRMDSSSVTGTQEAPKILSASTINLYSTDDAGVNEAEAYENNNYGLIYNMYNGWNPGGKKARTYIKFDLSGITLGSIIENATLWLLAKYGPSEGPPTYPDTWHLVDALGSNNDDWLENEITWNNAPTFGATVYDTENYIGDGLIEGSARAGENLDLDGKMVWYSWDVTSFIAAESAGNRLATIVLRGQNEFDNKYSSGWFYSRNGDNLDQLPYLNVTYAPPPWGAVTVIIAPGSKDGLRGSEQSFTVNVINMGGITDNYRMTLGDNAGWVLTLSDNLVGPDNRLENMAPGESRTLELTVKVPDDAPIDTQDNVWVKATAVDNEIITSTANVTVICTDKIDVRADSWVSDGIPNENTYGTSPLRLASFTQGDNRNMRTFLQFPLGAIPDGKNIESAKVWLHVSGVYGDDIDAQIFGVDNDDWEDKSITWNNQPPHGDALDTQTLTSWPENMEDTWVSWEVGDFVTSQRYYGDNTASFCIKAEVENTSGSYVFFSMTWTAVELRPKLVITFGAVQRSVSVSISPVHRIGNPYDTVTYEVKVMNKGNVTDNYTLENSDDQGWTMTLTPDSFENVLPGESRTATLSVTLPSTQGDEDSIKVTATGAASDSENCTASVKRAGGWEVAGYAPRIDNYGVAVTGVGSGSYIYVANSNTLGTRVNLMRYDTSTGEWDYRATPPIGSPFKNGAVLAWDGGDYIYALLGGSYNDVAPENARHYFYRYKISTNTWENLKLTGNFDNAEIASASNTGAQGAGDAMVVAGDYVYAIVGQNEIGSSFWRYNIGNNTWESRTLDWGSTDDGCSLVWTGGNNLYALRGEWQETTPSKEFARYSISGNSWTSLTDIPEPGGVGDGASLLWIEGDNIYATGGSQAYEPAETEGIDDNFYVYSISGNSWTQLEDLPAGIGAQNGPRLGAGSDIYAWRGTEDDPVLWVYTLEIPSWTGTATFSLVDLYTVNVEKILNLYQGSKLVVKFYTHGWGYENENVIETFTTPPLWPVEENEIARHPEGIGVSKARLDLTSDDTSDVISTIASFIVRKVHLETRFMDIPFWWSQADAAGKVVLETEFMGIPFYWSQAPS